jgi:RNA polymerase sigma-70 factor (ECF subfamily)
VQQLADERAAPPRYDDEIVALRGCLEKLPEKSRALVDMYYYKDIATAEIAEQMGMKADTVCRAICRLREKLRDCIARVLNGGTAHV